MVVRQKSGVSGSVTLIGEYDDDFNINLHDYWEWDGGESLLITPSNANTHFPYDDGTPLPATKEVLSSAVVATTTGTRAGVVEDAPGGTSGWRSVGIPQIRDARTSNNGNSLIVAITNRIDFSVGGRNVVWRAGSSGPVTTEFGPQRFAQTTLPFPNEPRSSAEVEINVSRMFTDIGRRGANGLFFVHIAGPITPRISLAIFVPTHNVPRVYTRAPASRTVAAGQTGISLGSVGALFPIPDPLLGTISHTASISDITPAGAGAASSARIDSLGRIILDTGNVGGVFNLSVKRTITTTRPVRIVSSASQFIRVVVTAPVTPPPTPPTTPEVPEDPDVDEDLKVVTRIKDFDNRDINWDDQRTYQLSDFFNFDATNPLNVSATTTWVDLTLDTGTPRGARFVRSTSLVLTDKLQVEFDSLVSLVANRRRWANRNPFTLTLRFGSATFSSLFNMLISDDDLEEHFPFEEEPEPVELRPVTRKRDFNLRSVPWTERRLYTLSTFFNFDAGEPLSISTNQSWVKLGLTGATGGTNTVSTTALQANSAFTVEFGTASELASLGPNAGFNPSNDFVLAFRFGEESFSSTFSMIVVDDIGVISRLGDRGLVQPFTTILVDPDVSNNFSAKRTDVQSTRRYTVTSSNARLRPRLTGNRLNVSASGGERLPSLGAGLRGGYRPYTGNITLTGETLPAPGLTLANPERTSDTFRVSVLGREQEQPEPDVEEGGVTYSVRVVASSEDDPDVSDMLWNETREFDLSEIYDLSRVTDGSNSSTFTITPSEPWVTLSVRGATVTASTSGGITSYSGDATEDITVNVGFDVTQVPSGGFDKSNSFDIDIDFGGYDGPITTNEGVRTATRYTAFEDTISLDMIVLRDIDEIDRFNDITFPTAQDRYNHGRVDTKFSSQPTGIGATRTYRPVLSLPNLPNSISADIRNMAPTGLTLDEAIRWYFTRELNRMAVEISSSDIVFITTGDLEARARCVITATDTSATEFSPALTSTASTEFSIRVDPEETVVREDPRPTVPTRPTTPTTPTGPRRLVTTVRQPDSSDMMWYETRIFPMHELFRYFRDTRTTFTSTRPNESQALSVSVTGAPWVDISWKGISARTSTNAAGVTRRSWSGRLTDLTENVQMSFSTNAPLGGFSARNPFTLAFSFSGSGVVVNVPITMVILNDLGISAALSDVLLATNTTDADIGDADDAFTIASLPTRETRSYTVGSTSPDITVRLDGDNHILATTNATEASSTITLTATATSNAAFAVPITATSEQDFGLASTDADPLQPASLPDLCLRSYDAITFDASDGFTNTDNFRLVNEDSARNIHPVTFGADIASIATWESNGSQVTIRTGDVTGYASGNVTITGTTGIGANASVTFKLSVLSRSSTVALGGLDVSVTGRTCTVTPENPMHPATPSLDVQYQIQVRSDDGEGYARKQRVDTEAVFELPDGFDNWTAEAVMFWDCFASEIVSDDFVVSPLVQGQFDVSMSGVISLAFTTGRGATRRPIEVGDVTDFTVTVESRGYRQTFVPTVSSAQGGVVRASVTVPYEDIYEVDLSAEISGTRVTGNARRLMTGPTAALPRGFGITLDGVDITRSVTGLSYGDGRRDSSGVLRTSSGSGRLVMTTQLDVNELVGSVVRVFYGDNQMYTADVSDATITKDGIRKATLQMFGFYSRLANLSVDFATRGISQARALSQILGDAGFTYRATREGVDLPPMRLVGTLQSAVAEIMKFGGTLVEDAFGGFVFGTDGAVPFQCVEGYGNQGVRVYPVSRVTGREQRRANIYNAAFGVTDETIRELPEPISTDVRAGVVGDLGFNYYYGFDLTVLGDSTDATLIRRGTTADVTTTPAGSREVLTAYAYRDYESPITVDIDQSSAIEHAVAVPSQHIPRNRVGEASTRQILNEIIADSQEQDIVSVDMKTPTATEVFGRMDGIRSGRYVFLNNEQRIMESTSISIEPGLLSVKMNMNRNLYEANLFIIGSSDIGEGDYLGSGDATPIPRFIIGVSRIGSRTEVI